MRPIDADKLITDRDENGTDWHLGEREAFRRLVERQPTVPRLTPEEERLVELGRAVEYAATKHDPRPIVIVSIEGFMGWYRKEVAR